MEKIIKYGIWKFTVNITAIKERSFFRILFDPNSLPKDVTFEYEGKQYTIPTKEDVWEMYDDIGNFLMNKAIEARTDSETATLRDVIK